MRILGAQPAVDYEDPVVVAGRRVAQRRNAPTRSALPWRNGTEKQLHAR